MSQPAEKPPLHSRWSCSSATCAGGVFLSSTSANTSLALVAVVTCNLLLWCLFLCQLAHLCTNVHNVYNIPTHVHIQSNECTRSRSRIALYLIIIKYALSQTHNWYKRTVYYANLLVCMLYMNLQSHYYSIDLSTILHTHCEMARSLIDFAIWYSMYEFYLKICIGTI